MTEVTREMILDYLVKKGGVVKNVDLVRHFRKYLQVEDPALKGKLPAPHNTPWGGLPIRSASGCPISVEVERRLSSVSPLNVGCAQLAR